MYGGGWLGGWSFNITNFTAGNYSLNIHENNTWYNMSVLITAENDHGYTYVSGNHKAGENFITNMTKIYETSLGAKCEKVSTKDTLDGHYYYCKFVGQESSSVKTKMNKTLDMKLSGSNDIIHLNLDDILV